MHVLHRTCAVVGRVAESRRHRHHHSPKAAYRTHKLFVFGDDFADDGNGDSDSVAWHQPFGMSDTAHGRKPTGRFSDGLVQSDFLAKIMGHSESPPPYTGDDWDNGIDASGLNFAVAGAAALDVTGGVLNISAQVQQLRNLVRDGLVDDRDFKESVALVAYSGNDYTSQDVRDEPIQHHSISSNHLLYIQVLDLICVSMPYTELGRSGGEGGG